MTKEWCYTWAHDLDQYDLVSFIDANKQQKENWWKERRLSKKWKN